MPRFSAFTPPLLPDPDRSGLTEEVRGVDHRRRPTVAPIIAERPLTLFLNGQEIVTLMTIGDLPRELAVGYLLNQAMLKTGDVLTAVDHDDETQTVVVRTERQTDYEDKLRRRTQTSGCAQGTSFGDMLENLSPLGERGAILKTSQLYELTRKINMQPSLYLKAGAVHGCVLCEKNDILIYTEDVGRHNAVDKIAGLLFLNGIDAENKLLYTTGRLTGEMIVKCVHMRIPVLVSRSGFTAWGVELARRANLTLIGRARGRRFSALTGIHRLEFDAATPDASDRDRDDENRKARSSGVASSGEASSGVASSGVSS